MCYKNNWQKKLRSFLVGNVFQNKCSARNSARQGPTGLAILTGFPHHLPLHLPFVSLDLTTGAIASNSTQQRGCEETQHFLWDWNRQCICPRRWHSVLATSWKCSNQVFLGRMCATRGSELGNAESEWSELAHVCIQPVVLYFSTKNSLSLSIST